MSTNSHIGILYKNGEIEAVYCHWDGYLQHNGVILYDNLKTLDQVKSLIAKGNISFIDFDKTKNEFCAEHYVDRGEKLEDNEAKTFVTEKGYSRFLHRNRFIEHSYLFSEEENKWLYLKNNSNVMLSPLEDALRKNKIIEHETNYFEMITFDKKEYQKVHHFLYEHDSFTRHALYSMKTFYDGDSQETSNNVVLFLEEFSVIGGIIEKFLIEKDIPYSLISHNQEQSEKKGNMDFPSSFYLEILKEARSICPLFEERINTEESNLSLHV